MTRSLSLKRFYGDAMGPLGFPMRSDVAKAVEAAMKAQSAECKEVTTTVLLADGSVQEVQGYARRYFVSKKVELGEREEVSWVTTNAIDRDFEVVVPAGLNWKQFLKNPIVPWAHDYRSLPVGRNLWVTRDKGKKVDGWKAKTRYLTKPPEWQGDWFPDAVWHLTRMGDIRGKSIGFVPTVGHRPSPQDIKKRPDLADVFLIIDKAIVIEYSVAPVQSNPDALVEHVADLKTKGIIIPESILQDVGVLVPDQVEIIHTQERSVEEEEEPETKTPARASPEELRETVRREIVIAVKGLDVDQMVRDAFDLARGRV